ncbi:MAG: gamma-glutamyl-gamma-aminobutyrate hydrolase family protein [Eubacteriaceae bacterium]|nr:gamma-glutamyl-gamma-aminobutyrate hydrolase family protein [Eubacteriaceae bacterium]
MKRPMIGLSANTSDDGLRIDIRKNYPESIMLAGGIPVILPHPCSGDDARLLAEELDGILFTGGGDADPVLYGEEKLPQCHEPDHDRDSFELELFRAARELGRPILGICRGCQLINVAMGGTLVQDIPSQRPDAVPHYQSQDGTNTFHSVNITESSLLHGIIGKDLIEVNSFHHQAVRDPAPGLAVSAFASDGIIEAVEGTEGSFLLGVQWHPEYMSRIREDMLGIFKAFIKEAQK